MRSPKAVWRGVGAVLAAGALNACGPAGEPTAASRSVATVFVNVAVIPLTDPSGEERLTGRTVVVRNGRITAVGRAGEVAIPAGAELIAGGGRVLSPGLFDMCARGISAHDAPLFIRHGVTTVRVSGATAEHATLSGRIAAGGLVGPRLILSPELQLDGTTEPAAARGAAGAVAALGFGSLTLVADGRESVGGYRAAVTAAQAAGLDVWAAKAPGVPVETTLSLGVDAVEGLDGFGAAAARAAPSQGDSAALDSHGAWTQADPDALARLAGYAAHYQAWICAAVTAESDAYARAAGPRAESDGVRRVTPATRREAWAAATAGWDPAAIARAAAAAPVRRDFVRQLSEAGAPLMMGTGAPAAPHTAAGLSLHDEIAHYRAAGMPFGVVLRIAAAEAARFLGEEGRSGVVATGARADLILAERDPRRDPSVLRNPEGVMAAGVWLERPALRALARDAQRRAR